MTISVWYADGPDSPRISPSDALAAADMEVPTGDPIDVTIGWTIESHDWLSDPTFRIRTVLAGYGLAKGVNDGTILPLPVRLSAVPSLIAARIPDLAVVAGIRRGDTVCFGSTVGWADYLAANAKAVLVEIDDKAPDLGGPPIPGNIVGVVARAASATSPPVASRVADDIDLLIGGRVASLLPDEPTLQFGPGGIGEGIARALTRPVHLWSGLLTDAMASLQARDLLLSPAVGAYAWGEGPIRELATTEMLRLTSSTITHDMSRLSSIPRFVSCNTAVQVGLDGAINVERAGTRIIASVGGHADFCAGASRSTGGLSIIACRSTTAKGASTIVGSVDVVSTPRCDIDIVVTEHGVADLREISDAERKRRLIAIAAPEHRSALE